MDTVESDSVVRVDLISQLVLGKLNGKQTWIVLTRLNVKSIRQSVYNAGGKADGSPPHEADIWRNSRFGYTASKFPRTRG
jgi:hypothetical protein